MRKMFCLLSVFVVCGQSLTAPSIASVFPGTEWKTKRPAELHVSQERLRASVANLGSRGFLSHKGFKTCHTGKSPSTDEPAAVWEPRLETLNTDSCRKDPATTWRHSANQTSARGLAELPGPAFAYRNCQMAVLLFWDIVFKEVYEDVFPSLLTDAICFQDVHTKMAFGMNGGPGRLRISPRNHPRFGLLSPPEGNWKGTQLRRADVASQAIRERLPHIIPRPGFEEAEMIEGQRGIDSTPVPDNPTPHRSRYRWRWWIDGVDTEGHRYWPDVPAGPMFGVRIIFPLNFQGLKLQLFTS